MQTLQELPEPRQEVIDIVVDTLKLLWQRKVSLSHAQGIFTGAKVFALLEARVNGMPPECSGIVPLLSPDEPDFVKLAELMRAGDNYTPSELRALALENQLFSSWLTSETIHSPRVLSRFGLLCEKAAGQKFPKGTFLMSGNDRTRRYFISASPDQPAPSEYP
jgi:hypothetical protein